MYFWKVEHMYVCISVCVFLTEHKDLMNFISVQFVGLESLTLSKWFFQKPKAMGFWNITDINDTSFSEKKGKYT